MANNTGNSLSLYLLFLNTLHPSTLCNRSPKHSFFFFLKEPNPFTRVGGGGGSPKQYG